MKKRKIILAAIVLLLIFLVGGAIAYFTDIESATNTFTIGDVDITLEEDGWVTTDTNNNGVPDAAEGKMPGENITKDPTITNVGSNDAYVFAKVVSACTTDAAPKTPKEIFIYTTHIKTGWYLMDEGTCTNGTITRIYAYGSSTKMTKLVKPNGSTTDSVVLFDKVTINPDITGDEAGLTEVINQGTAEEATQSKKLDVVVTGYAIQADGINAESPSDVWAAASGFNS